MKKFKNRLLALISLALLLAVVACGAKTWEEHYDLGMKYLSEGKYEEAILSFTSAIEIDPKREDAYIGRGNAYTLLPENEENLGNAYDDYSKVLELNDTNPDAYLGLADVYIRRGEYDKAEEILRKGLEKTGNDERIAEKIAEIEKGEYSDSKKLVRRKNSYNMDNVLIGYTEYQYDDKGRKISWQNYDCEYDEFDNPTDEFVLENYSKVTYGKNGLEEKREFFNPDGSSIGYDTFEYNDRDLVSKQIRHNPEGHIDSYFLYYYDDAGKRTKYEGYSSDGEMYNYWTYEYDADGNLIQEKTFAPDGTQEGYSVQ